LDGIVLSLKQDGSTDVERPTRTLALTGLEVVFLTDGVMNRDIAEGLPDRDAYVPLARQTLLLLGSAYRELVSTDGIKPGPVCIEVTEEIAWLLRGKVRTGDVAIDGTTNVGVPLLLKFYDILNAFNSEIDGLPPVTNYDGHAVSEVDRQFLQLLKEGTDARTKPNDNPGPDARA
jgi:hypothetical protein